MRLAVQHASPSTPVYYIRDARGNKSIICSLFYIFKNIFYLFFIIITETAYFFSSWTATAPADSHFDVPGDCVCFVYNCLLCYIYLLLCNLFILFISLSLLITSNQYPIFSSLFVSCIFRWFFMTPFLTLIYLQFLISLFYYFIILFD